MQRSPDQLRSDAVRIWWAGVRAVQPPSLIFGHVHVDGSVLCIADEAIELDEVDRIAVVGGGKASAGLAVSLEQALGPDLLRKKQLTGVVNVPADCVVPTVRIALHAARAAGVNEPTAAGVRGVEQMLQLVGSLGPRDLCIALISGGGSALMPAPIDGLTLEDKLAVTRELSARGATIHQLNAVRRALSQFKAGGLARACRAARLWALILSDVPGDDLVTVASGPTVDAPRDEARAAAVLREMEIDSTPAGRRALALLSRNAQTATAVHQPVDGRVRNILLANNAAAVDAAGVEAERLGYSHAMLSATEPEGRAAEVARQLAAMADRMRREPGPDCLITGGEPTVQLAPADRRGRGGRNQQLALSAFAELADWQGVALLSGGTDGEDGPTDAAGALVDEQIVREARRQSLDPASYLDRNDAYSFFEQTGGLLKTGPTHTNVCDLRVITVSR